MHAKRNMLEKRHLKSSEQRKRKQKMKKKKPPKKLLMKSSLPSIASEKGRKWQRRRNEKRKKNWKRSKRKMRKSKSDEFNRPERERNGRKHGPGSIKRVCNIPYVSLIFFSQKLVPQRL